MTGLMPYIVLVVVAVVFFILCYLLFYRSSTDESPTNTYHHEYKDEVEERVSVPAVTTYEHSYTEPSDVDTVEVTAVTPEQEPIENTDVTMDEENTDFTNHTEDTVALGESEEVLEITRAMSSDVTQMIGTEGAEIVAPQGPSILEETRLFDVKEMEKHLEADELEAEVEATAGPWAQSAQEDKRVTLAMEPFMAAFGTVHSEAKGYVESITRSALTGLTITKLSEVQGLLRNMVIQEALLAMQKAYAITPTPWMKTAALEAFFDVVQSPKSSTQYLVAFDAFRILPHITLGHFQIMAVLLLLQYSRNSNNYGRIHFEHYVEKYIEPFISDLPHDASFYRQLEYLRCIQQEREQITLTQLLSNSYPFVFNYRGFTKEELLRVTDNRGVDPRFVVRSLNSNLYKLALVDESLASRFFRKARISNSAVQRDLLSLMKSKPTSFKGSEARQILDDISPVLADLATLYDTTPMSHISLTVLGLYLGRAHVKAIIGEEFDVSYWL